jgi:hypothetical protein
MLAAMAAVMGHAPQEAMDIFSAPRPPRDPPDPKDPKGTTRNMKTAQELEVEVPQPPAVSLDTRHAMAAIIKAQQPKLNRKQRRQLAHRMQARATKARGG